MKKSDSMKIVKLLERFSRVLFIHAYALHTRCNTSIDF